MSRHWTGTSGFSYTAWRDKFYPKLFKTDQMLSFYSDRFSTVEVNNSFYRLPTESALAQWAAKVPERFLFAFKAPGAITHRYWSAASNEIIDSFLGVIATLKGRLGPALFQFPPYLKKDLTLLEKILERLPRNRRAAFEFRNPTWFDAQTYALLEKKHAALVYNDADIEAMPFVATADWGYLRLRRTTYTDQKLRAIADQCQAKKWSDLFLYFKHEDNATGPALASRWISLIKK